MQVRKKLSVLTGLIAVLAVSFFYQSAVWAQTTIKLQAPDTENLGDAYVDAAFPDSNTGNDTIIRISSADWYPSGYRRGYLKFNISSLPRAQNIVEAKLYLYQSNSLRPANISVHHIKDHTWDEYTITWENQPCGTNFDNSTSCNLKAEDSIMQDILEGWWVWSVAEMVKDEYYSGDKNVSMALKQEVENVSILHYSLFVSKDTENTSLGPYLNITYTPYPLITIFSPTNTTTLDHTPLLNATMEDVNPDSMWYSIDGGSNSSIYRNTQNLTLNLSSLEDGPHYVTVYANDTDGNLNSSTRYFNITSTDTVPPLWRNLGTNDSDDTIFQGDSITLNAQGYDETGGLDWAILRTNESGTWVNQRGETYGSPMDMGNAIDTWKWSNFNWSNSSFYGLLGFRILYNDTWGNWNATDVRTVTVIPFGWLNATILTLGDNAEWTQNSIRWVNATITCEGEPGAICGVVKGGARYNDSSATPDRLITIEQGATPFYITEGGKLRPISWVEAESGGNYTDPTYAYDNDYNDTTTYAHIEAPTYYTESIKYMWDTSSDGSSNATLYYTWNTTLDGIEGTVYIRGWNYSSGSWAMLKESPSSEPLATRSEVIDKDFINSTGNIEIKFEAFGGFSDSIIDLYDVHVDIPAVNPVSCGLMNKGDLCQLNWSVNATGNIETTYKIDVNFSSNYSQVPDNDTTDNTIKITGLNTVLYYPDMDVMVINGYSAENPATFNDVYSADKAGELVLMAPKEPSMGMTLDRQIQPAEELALKITFNLTGTTDATDIGDSIYIEGTDKDGSYQNETLNINGDGNYTTTKWFRTITSFDAVGFSRGNITATQPRWGVISSFGGNMYMMHSKLKINPNSYFATENEQVFFEKDVDHVIDIGEYFRSGVVDSNGIPRNGSCLAFNISDHGLEEYRIIGTEGSNPNMILVYDSSIRNLIPGYGVIRPGYAYPEWLGMMDIRGSVLEDLKTVYLWDNTTLKDTRIIGLDEGFSLLGAIAGEISNTRVMDANIGLSTTALAQGETGIDTVVVENSRGSDVFMYWSGVNLSLTDVGLDNTKIKNRQSGSIVREKYSLDVKVVSQNGSAIPGANVSVYDRDGNMVFSQLTYSNGSIDTRGITYATYSKTGGQVLYSPHNLTITSSGYQAYTMKWNHTKEEDWTVAMTPE